MSTTKSNTAAPAHEATHQRKADAKAARKQERLLAAMVAMRNHTVQQLVFVLRDSGLSALAHEAAMRWLIGKAPLTATRGAPLGMRQQCVRQYYHL